MSTANHIIKSGLIVYPLYLLIGLYAAPFIALAMYLGGRSDFEKIFHGDAWDDWDNWYDILHDPERETFFGIKQKNIPFQNLHIHEDKAMHDPVNGGWYWWAYIHEAVQDLGLGFIVYIILKVHGCL